MTGITSSTPFSPFQPSRIHSAVVADDPDGRPLTPGNGASVVPHLLDHVDDVPISSGALCFITTSMRRSLGSWFRGPTSEAWSSRRNHGSRDSRTSRRPPVQSTPGPAQPVRTGPTDPISERRVGPSRGIRAGPITNTLTASRPLYEPPRPHRHEGEEGRRQGAPAHPFIPTIPGKSGAGVGGRPIVPTIEAWRKLCRPTPLGRDQASNHSPPHIVDRQLHNGRPGQVEPDPSFPDSPIGVGKGIWEILIKEGHGWVRATGHHEWTGAGHRIRDGPLRPVAITLQRRGRLNGRGSAILWCSSASPE